MTAPLKNLVLRAASVAGFLATARGRSRHAPRILAYHGVDPDAERPENFDGFQVPPGVFEDHLRLLTKHFSVLPLREIARALLDEKPLPENAVAITFDDGYANNFAVAAPALLKHGCPATFFLTTGFIDGTHQPWWYRVRAAASSVVALERELKDLPAAERDQRVAELAPDASNPYGFMSWSDADALHRQGFDLGAHGVSHASLGKESDDAIEAEVAGSVRRIAQMTGFQPSLFAYPYGRPADISEHAVTCLRREGCIAAVTTTEGMIERGDDLLHLKRFNVTGNHSRWALEARLSGF